ncbi:MAG: hypothetical protein ACRD5G_11155 [Candidatus Acidiferrales bacterium]
MSESVQEKEAIRKDTAPANQAPVPLQAEEIEAVASSKKRFRIRSLIAWVAAAGLILLLPAVLFAPRFLATAVRVTPNARVEFKWTTDVVWFGEVTIFDSTGTPILTRRSDETNGNPMKSTDHLITLPLLPPLAANTSYFFQVTSTDPTNNLPPIVTPVLPFFTGAQTIGSVLVNADTDSAVISWPANVIGFGRVEYGIASLNEFAVQDSINVTDHSIELNGLSPGATYQFRVSNVHAIDQDRLAETTGFFTTLGLDSSQRLRQGRARPAAIGPGQQSTLSVLAAKGNAPLSGIPVRFEVLPESPGSATLNGGSIADVQSDPAGRAMVTLTGVAPGVVRVKVSTPAAVNSVNIVVVVLR